MTPYLTQAISFLQEIGIPVQVVPGATGFLSHLRVNQGGLDVDPNCPVSNLLHEAGHLCCVPGKYRPLMSDNMKVGMGAMFKDLQERDVDPDSQEYRAAIQCSDPEATAWAWAAGRHLGIPDELIILDSEYDGAGADQRLGLQCRAHLGINGLSHAGFCVTRDDLSKIRGLPVYPKLTRWLQE